MIKYVKEDESMTDNEMLLAMSQMMDEKLKANLAPIENRLTKIKMTLEHNVVPRLQEIESCYTDTYERYKNYADKMQAAFDDIEILKQVVSEHSEKLQQLA